MITIYFLHRIYIVLFSTTMWTNGNILCNIILQHNYMIAIAVLHSSGSQTIFNPAAVSSILSKFHAFLQVWALNPDVEDPEGPLVPGQLVWAGRLYTTVPGDSSGRLNWRFGLAVEALAASNR